MSSQYLTLARFIELTLMSSADVSLVESKHPGWIANQSTVLSGLIDSRLRKRYAAPFSAPVPSAVEDWCCRLLTLRTYLKRGVDATDEQFDVIRKDAEDAIEQLKEAANAVDGLFDLPLRSDTTANGISKGAPLVLSEASPYTWTDEQWEAAQSE